MLQPVDVITGWDVWVEFAHDSRRITPEKVAEIEGAIAKAKARGYRVAVVVHKMENWPSRRYLDGFHVRRVNRVNSREHGYPLRVIDLVAQKPSFEGWARFQRAVERGGGRWTPAT